MLRESVVYLKGMLRSFRSTCPPSCCYYYGKPWLDYGKPWLDCMPPGELVEKSLDAEFMCMRAN